MKSKKRKATEAPGTLLSFFSPSASSRRSSQPQTATFQGTARPTVDAIIKNYSTLCQALEQIHAKTHDEYGLKAGGFLASLEKFSTYFGLRLSFLLFAASEQLSLSLQGKDTSAQEAITAATLCQSYLSGWRSMQKFDEFYASVVSDAKDLTNAPALPRYRKAPSRPGKDGDPAHRFGGPLEYFRQQYFEAIDVLVGQLKDRFEQRKGLPMAVKMEQILLEAANGDCCTVERLEEELQIYEKDLSMVQLHLQLQMLPNLVNTRNSLCKDQPPITKITKVRTIAELLTEVEVGKSMPT